MSLAKFSIQMLLRRSNHYSSMAVLLALTTLIVLSQSALFHVNPNPLTALIQDKTSIWVVNEPAMTPSGLQLIESLEGVVAIAPVFVGNAFAELPQGRREACTLIGIENGSALTTPSTLIQGELAKLGIAKNIVIDLKGSKENFAYRKLGKLRPLTIGGSLKIGGCLTSVVGICDTHSSHKTPIIYTNYDLASRLSKHSSKGSAYLLIKTTPHVTVETLSHQITQRTGAKTYTQTSLAKLPFFAYLEQAGIPRHTIGITLFSFLISAAIIAQFTSSYAQRQHSSFAIFKALGCSHQELYKLSLIQAALLSCMGWGAGTALYLACAALCPGISLLTLFSWKIALVSFISMLLIVSLISSITLTKFISSNHEAL